MFISVAEAKEYLRIDTDFEDTLIEQLILSAEKLCADVARLEISDFETSGDVAKIATFFTLGYMYENRANADYQQLPLILRSLLFSLRE